jgi:GNAT superfamily N-acetyltransferase
MKNGYFVYRDDILASISLLPGPVGVLVTGVEVSRSGRGQGRAQEVMDLLLADADAEGVALHLSCDPQEPDIDFDRLAAFYLRNGFEWSHGDLADAVFVRKPARWVNTTMVRRPR